MIPARSLFLILVLGSIVLAGCSSQFGEEEKIGCLPVTTTVLALGDPSPLGFSGQDVLDAAGHDYRGELVYEDGTRTELSLDVAYEGGEVRFHDNEWISDDGRDIAPALGCPDTVEVDVRVRVTTMDGAFAESWSETLAASEAASATFHRDLDGMTGTFDPAAHAAGTYDEVSAFLDATLGAAGAEGEVSGIGTQASGSGSDGVVSGTMLEFASFSAAPVPTDEALVGCLPVTTTALGPDDPSPLGFSANDVLAWADGTDAFDLTYADGSTTPATLSVSYSGGAIEYRDNEWMSAPGGSDAAPALGCEDDLQIEVTVSFRTDDGTFDESWTTRLTATVATRATLYNDLAAATGTFDPADYAPPGSTYDSIRAHFDAALESAGTTGTIDGQGEGTSGSGPEGVAYAESFPIASW